jgi:hypothetical protein
MYYGLEKYEKGTLAYVVIFVRLFKKPGCWCPEERCPLREVPLYML